MDTDEPSEALPTLPEDWSRALAVVAHPDDLEYGVAGAIARWTRAGKWVGYVLATAGEAGIDTMSPQECARVRMEEERRSAAVVGVDVVEFLGHPDGLLEASIPLRRDLAGAIRRHRPEVLISINHRDGWPGGFNHADHRNLGWALLDATRDAANRWLFPGFGGEPWAGVRFAAFGASPHATHAVDVTETMDLGIASLAEHRAYLDGLGDGGMADPGAFLRGAARSAGQRQGCEYAITFEVIHLA